MASYLDSKFVVWTSHISHLWGQKDDPSCELAEKAPVELESTFICPAAKTRHYQEVTSLGAASLCFDWSALNPLVAPNILYLIFLSIYEPPPEGPLLFSTHFITTPHFLFSPSDCPFSFTLMLSLVAECQRRFHWQKLTSQSHRGDIDWWHFHQFPTHYSWQETLCQMLAILTNSQRLHLHTSADRWLFALLSSSFHLVSLCCALIIGHSHWSCS